MTSRRTAATDRKEYTKRKILKYYVVYESALVNSSRIDYPSISGKSKQLLTSLEVTTTREQNWPESMIRDREMFTQVRFCPASVQINYTKKTRQVLEPVFVG